MKSDRILLFIGIFSLISERINTKRVIVYDTTRHSILRWTTYTANGQPEIGWLEESYTRVEDGANWRSYVVCDVTKDNVNNWLRTPFIERGPARRLSIEVTFAIRDCQKFPRTALTCKETFGLLAYEADVDFATRDQPAWTNFGPNSYKTIDRITAVGGRFTDQENLMVNVEIRHVPVTKKGVYFAFRDEGACISLLAVKVFYEVCEKTIINFAYFPETPVGQNLTFLREVRGQCVENAAIPKASNGPKYFCKGDGTWDLLSGGCQCNPGYKADGAKCSPCEPGFYKDTPGIASCTKCPANSVSNSIGSIFCECKDGFYRSPTDSKSIPCERIPSAPRGLKVLKSEPSQVFISWKPPEEIGNRIELWYRIDCTNCPPDTVYTPKKDRHLYTNATIGNLESGTTYTIVVYVENELTKKLAPKLTPSNATINITTEWASKSSTVTSIWLDFVSDDELTFTWDSPEYYAPPPMVDFLASGQELTIHNIGYISKQKATTLNPQQRLDSVRYYMVRLYMKDTENGEKKLVPPSVYSGGGETNNETVSITEARYTLKDLKGDTEYGFQVRANTIHGWSQWSEIFWTKTNVSTTFEEDPLVTIPNGDDTSGNINSLGVISGIIAAVVLVLIIVLGILYWACFWNKSNSSKREEPRRDQCVLDLKKDPVRIVHCQPQEICARWNEIRAAGSVKSHFNTPQSLYRTPNVKQYVDPLTYEDPIRLLKDFTREIDQNDLRMEHAIGEGEFGQVCIGQLRIQGKWQVVAIKTLKRGSSTKAKSDFLLEASIMGQFRHENVIMLKGVITTTEPVSIITEYMENGSLDKYLQTNKHFVDLSQQLYMLHCIACGMAYLSEMGYVHRDLAARNVLVDSSLLCKIADFGLSRGLVDGSAEQVYMTKVGGKIPVRWTAWEALLYQKFTSASDVWSFGVVMWEVMTYGQRPYGTWSNQDVIKNILENGYRLDAPENCPKAVSNLMQECWNQERQLRPIFPEILRILDQLLQQFDTTVPTASDVSTATTFTHGCTNSSRSSFVMRPSTSGFTYHPTMGVSYLASSSATAIIPSNPLAIRQISQPSLVDANLANISIDEFLHGLNLDHLSPIFETKNRRYVSDLTRLTTVDFEHMGIPPGARRQILDAINELRRQNYATVADATMPRRNRIQQDRAPKGPPPPPPPPPLTMSTRLHAYKNSKGGNFV